MPETDKSGTGACRFTLCPAGHNPESYRIYEALMVGSIPIIHDTCLARDDFGVTRCSCEGWTRFLKETGAPFPFIADWSELDAVLAPYYNGEGGATKLDELQRRTVMWHNEFLAHYKYLMITKLFEPR